MTQNGDQPRRPRVRMDVEFVHAHDLRIGNAIVTEVDSLPEIVRHVRLGKDRHGPYVALTTDRHDRLVFREGDKLARVL